MNKTTKLIPILALSTILAGCSDRGRDRNPYGPPAYPAQSPDAPQNKFGFPEALSGPSLNRVTTADVREEARSTAPGIPVQAAPGVAFTYRYAFLLPDESIAAVQEKHAAACEALGPSRCRITGMRFTRMDESRVAGFLQFKLAPELARDFGKGGIGVVEKAKGKLVDAAIEGTDVAAQMTESERRSGDLRARLAEIERQLVRGNLVADQRSELQRQAEQIRQSLTNEVDSRASGQAQLANTPMTYVYTGTEGFTPGDHPVGDAADGFQASFSTMVAVVLTTVGVTLPWLLPLGLLGWIGLALRRRFRRVDGDTPPATETAPATQGEA